jgi:hypothetical protein
MADTDGKFALEFLIPERAEGLRRVPAAPPAPPGPLTGNSRIDSGILALREFAGERPPWASPRFARPLIFPAIAASFGCLFIALVFAGRVNWVLPLWLLLLPALALWLRRSELRQFNALLGDRQALLRACYLLLQEQQELEAAYDRFAFPLNLLLFGLRPHGFERWSLFLGKYLQFALGPDHAGLRLALATRISSRLVFAGYMTVLIFGSNLIPDPAVILGFFLVMSVIVVFSTHHDEIERSGCAALLAVLEELAEDRPGVTPEHGAEV